jgi:hypothetical protein
MTPFILFTVFCMRLHMNDCHVEAMDDRPFATLAQCEAAIEIVNREQFDLFERATLLSDGGNMPIPMAHWCAGKDW